MYRSDLLYSKFTSVIMRHFVEYGCTTVVLAFDDKRYVPKAKAITQLKRRAGVNILQFSETDVLPTDLPVEWKEAIMSPWFKHRVIELICTNMPRLVRPPKSGSKLVIDWETVTQYTYHDEGEPPTMIRMTSSSDIGEADLKFTRWMKILQCPMLIEATDGDYIPIAMGLKTAGFSCPVTILKAWNQEKGFEFINIDALLGFLSRKLNSCANHRPPGCQWWEVCVCFSLFLD